MKKVWIVTDFVLNGKFVGVFSSKEAAEKVIRAYCNSVDGRGSSINDFTYKEVEFGAIHPDYLK